MKYEGAVARYHSVSELAHAIDGMSRDGFRVINVLDRSSAHQDTFLVIAQKEIPVSIKVDGFLHRNLRTGEPDEKFGE